ncbi:hypothetical protein PLICRDRAFT_144122 [Plicaturopsis crispa FD-325 SS-3]|nr:hypothetical protein PLICRDRAFT_144122 [Plicaturopsis crispa FD-325 SS-3]
MPSFLPSGSMPRLELGFNGWDALSTSAVYTRHSRRHDIPRSAWTDSATMPAYVAVASALLIGFKAIVASSIVKRALSRFHLPISPSVTVHDPSSSDSSPTVKERGETIIFAFDVARASGCFLLLCLSIFSLVENVGPEATQAAAGHCLIYAYVSLLSLSSVLLDSKRSRHVKLHLVVVLLVAWSVFSYRNLWPLATFTLVPRDRADGWLLWAKAVVLTSVSIVVPLFSPRRYVPFNASDPREPSPEETCSLFSFATYGFLDPLLAIASRVLHVPHSQLPPLSDRDYARNLVSISFQYLDPFATGAAQVGMIRGFFKIFRREYIIIAILNIIRSLGVLASPVAINRLLDYMEHGDVGVVVRPWVWISWLFLGPLIRSLTMQGYFYLSGALLVRIEAILTQLVFEHSLRIRMVADAPPSASQNPSTSQASVKKPTEASARNIVGKISNLVSSDLGNINAGREFPSVLYAPLQIILCIGFLYRILGWSAFVGFAAMLVLVPVPIRIASMIKGVQIDAMKKMDARVQAVSEVMNVVRMVKLFGWESKMSDRVDAKREDELKSIWKRKMYGVGIEMLNAFIPGVTMMTTFVTYTMIMKGDLDASRVFSAMTVFNIIQEQLRLMFKMVPWMIQAKVSLDRLSDFLHDTELLDSYANTLQPEGIKFAVPEGMQNDIGICHARFSWSNAEHDGCDAGVPTKQFHLRIEEKLIFQRGGINLVVGPTGCGKTSLLMALLGEMHFIATGPESWYNLPRDGGVAYAAQESWVHNETIRDNILFGSPYDEARYDKVIYQCALRRDIDLFEAGDATEVGEKGLTLSGGQKARITLARAVYSTADILLLDDVLAALDVHTSKWIIEKCFAGDLIRGRTVILVTHNVALASPITDNVVSMGSDGNVLSQGTVADVLASDTCFSAEYAREKAFDEQMKNDADAEELQEEIKRIAPNPKADGKLITAEEIDVGHVNWPSLKLFFSSVGGAHILLFWTITLAAFFSYTMLETTQIWWLGYWSSRYSEMPSTEVSVPYYLSIYGAILLGTIFLYSFTYAVFTQGSLRASRLIHQKLIQSVLGTTLQWLDKTPVSRVITRCTIDIRTVDGEMPLYLTNLMEITAVMIVKFAAIALLTPIFVFVGIITGAIGIWLGGIYMKAQLSVKRETSNAKAPVLAHVGGALAGLTSVRAYGTQDSFKRESLYRIDRYSRANKVYFELNRWISLRLDVLGGVLASFLAAYFIYWKDSSKAHDTGFSLNMAAFLGSLVLWWIKNLNDFEVSGDSLERIQGYLNIEQEPKPTIAGIPPAYWPSSGSLQVEKLSARYSQNGPDVLHDISFDIRSGQRIGVVGRTGSGKSSLTLALLRCIFTDGVVYYDGLPTNSINLDALRSSITIIPQVPELLSGTLRQNLDPLGQYDDAVLNDALRASGLHSLQAEEKDGRITLESPIASAGGNLSVGQRQIIALARAILCPDYKTDSIIQSTLRRALGRDVTVITVAHRLQTIMDADKIMVLDAGRIAEFDGPSELLRNEKSLLRALVDESGDKEKLYALAADKASVV